MLRCSKPVPSRQRITCASRLVGERSAFDTTLKNRMRPFNERRTTRICKNPDSGVSSVILMSTSTLHAPDLEQKRSASDREAALSDIRIRVHRSGAQSADDLSQELMCVNRTSWAGLSGGICTTARKISAAVSAGSVCNIVAEILKRV